MIFVRKKQIEVDKVRAESSALKSKVEGIISITVKIIGWLLTITLFASAIYTAAFQIVIPLIEPNYRNKISLWVLIPSIGLCLLLTIGGSLGFNLFNLRQKAEEKIKVWLTRKILGTQN